MTEYTTLTTTLFFDCTKQVTLRDVIDKLSSLDEEEDSDVIVLSIEEMNFEDYDSCKVGVEITYKREETLIEKLTRESREDLLALNKEAIEKVKEKLLTSHPKEIVYKVMDEIT